jgi:hypothetical protein
MSNDEFKLKTKEELNQILSKPIKFDVKSELITEIDTVLKNDVVTRHSYFQMKYFLIGKEPTNQSKMWKCLQELKVRREAIANCELEEEETKDHLELLDISIEKLNTGTDRFGIDLDEFTARENIVKIRQIERKKKAALANLATLAEKRRWLQEESKFFLETFKNIQKTEELKPFDDLDAQKEYWSEKLARKLNLKMLTNNQLNDELIETIVMLPDDLPLKKQTLSTLNVRHAQMVENMKDAMKKLDEKK